ncbi:MAG TPA: histidinol-phosphatase, partial [Usitatibacteraceae bacterium]|nr:histidinol-phosphatase [Usitatibacteraceae bacterium]
MAPSDARLEEFRAFADRLADAAALAIEPHFRVPLAVQDKGGARFDPVTEADRAAERAMRALIREHYPDHGILGEEEDAVAGAGEFTWVLDPIDGTRAFITGMPLWGTLIALNDGTRPILGIMNQPFTGERYVGTGTHAWRNGEPIRARRCAGLSTARVMCTSPQLFDSPARLAAFESVAAEAQLVRYGGDCYAYCMVASGFVDVVIEAGLKPYDTQALIPILEGAGGRMTSWEGGSAQHGGAVIACGDPALHDRLV